MSRTVNLVVDKIFDVFPTTFRLARDRCQNRTSKEHPELRTPEGQLTGWFHLTPGTYSISFKGILKVVPGEVVTVTTSRELVRNGMFLVSQNFSEGYHGTIELNLHVTVAPFEFHRDSILGTLEITDTRLALTGNYALNPNLTAAAPSIIPRDNIMFTGNEFPVHNNPFLDSVVKLEELDKTLPKETPPVVEKKTNVLKGRKWAYLEVNGEITHKLRISPEEIEEYTAKGYIIAYPPSMNHKGE